LLAPLLVGRRDNVDEGAVQACGGDDGCHGAFSGDVDSDGRGAKGRHQHLHEDRAEFFFLQPLLLVRLVLLVPISGIGVQVGVPVAVQRAIVVLVLVIVAAKQPLGGACAAATIPRPTSPSAQTFVRAGKRRKTKT
jgi:hypothetical protein